MGECTAVQVAQAPPATRTAAAPSAAPGVKVGVDVAAIGEVADAIGTFGDRYVRRLFTTQEIESCAGSSGAASLAARFAAKEAVLKVLEPSGVRPPWRDIEIVRHPSGACRVRLHGRAAALAAERGLGSMSVSLSHEGGVAVAVVAAACQAGRADTDTDTGFDTPTGFDTGFDTPTGPGPKAVRPTPIERENSRGAER